MGRPPSVCSGERGPFPRLERPVSRLLVLLTIAVPLSMMLSLA